MKFTDETILRLFGNEAADTEDAKALRGYYFKNDAYDQIHSNIPLRILVGHKGTGKSALFRISEMEDEEEGVLSVFLRPDDVAGVASQEEDLLKLIRAWKEGLNEIILRKVLLKLSVEEAVWKKTLAAGGVLVNTLAECLKKVKGEVSLNPARQRLVEFFLRSNTVNIYIDDLDRGWEAKRSDIRRISALLNAARDLSGESPGLRFKISLRSDVYFLVRTSDESTDKIEGSVVWFRWTNHEILALLVKRLDHFRGLKREDSFLVSLDQHQLASSLDFIAEPRFFGKGKWENIPMHRMMLSLIRQRPRDLVKLCTMAAKDAYRDRAELIGTRHFNNVFDQYSQERLQDTINEFRSELPTIDELLLNMRPSRKERERGQLYMYSPSDLLKKIEEIMGRKRFTLANGKTPDAKDIALFLFKINFIHARKQLPDGSIDRKYFEDNRYIANRSIDFGYSWEIHAAYRWALLPENVGSIIDTLD